jgi:hypothetical protein
MPATTRPAESRSRVASRRASTTGGWNRASSTLVPNRTRSVCAATQVSVSSGVVHPRVGLGQRIGILTFHRRREEQPFEGPQAVNPQALGRSRHRSDAVRARRRSATRKTSSEAWHVHRGPPLLTDQTPQQPETHRRRAFYTAGSGSGPGAGRPSLAARRRVTMLLVPMSVSEGSSSKSTTRAATRIITTANRRPAKTS